MESYYVILHNRRFACRNVAEPSLRSGSTISQNLDGYFSHLRVASMALCTEFTNTTFNNFYDLARHQYDYNANRYGTLVLIFFLRYVQLELSPPDPYGSLSNHR